MKKIYCDKCRKVIDDVYSENHLSLKPEDITCTSPGHVFVNVDFYVSDGSADEYLDICIDCKCELMQIIRDRINNEKQHKEDQ